MSVEARACAKPPDQQSDKHRRGKRIAPKGNQAVHGARTVNWSDMSGSVAKLYKEMLNASENGSFSQ
ncbi:MAG: hypothetical protein ABIN68_05590, partial [Sphingomicrobium sp.]